MSEASSDQETRTICWQMLRERTLALGGGFPLALAVSGGGDSMALLALAAEWARAEDRLEAVTVLTVDHGLRRAAEGEARLVVQVCARLGLRHVTLTCTQDLGSANLQARARHARYALLEDWCRTHGVGTLLTAHTLEDQAETVLLRLARGSGVDGLGAMRQRVPLADPAMRPSVTLLRPLLDVRRQALRDVLERCGLEWIEDPSNEDPRFDRVKVRDLWPRLEGVGLTPARLAATASRMARVRDLLEAETSHALQRCAQWDSLGFIRLDTSYLCDLHEELALRVLARTVERVRGWRYPPRLNGLERLRDALREDGFSGATLGGCRFSPHRGGSLVTREARHLEEAVPLTPGRACLWDGRVRVTLPDGAPGTLAVSALGRSGLAVLREQGLLAQEMAEIPPAARAVLPAIRCREEPGRLLCVGPWPLDPAIAGAQVETVAMAVWKFMPT